MSGCRISSASSSWSSRTRFASTLSPSSILKLSSACLRSEEHTSELQSQSNLVCRLLLEKKKKLPEANRNTIRLNLTHIKVYTAFSCARTEHAPTSEDR